MRTSRESRLAWDGVARSLPDLLPASTTGYYRRCEELLIRREIGDLSGKSVLKLDLWNEAKNTRILDWIRSQGAHSFGIDLSLVVTAGARTRSVREGRPLRTVAGDILELPFPADAFDFVYTMGTIEHLADYRRAVREITRVLRPGGRAIVGVPHTWNIFLRPAMVKALDLFRLYPYSPEKSFSARELRRVLEGGGLRVTRRTGILTLPGVVRMLDLSLLARGTPSRRFIPLLTKPFGYLEQRWRWPGRFGYLLAMVAEKVPGR